jgi:hypothetical protein
MRILHFNYSVFPSRVAVIAAQTPSDAGFRPLQKNRACSSPSGAEDGLPLSPPVHKYREFPESLPPTRCRYTHRSLAQLFLCCPRPRALGVWTCDMTKQHHDQPNAQPRHVPLLAFRAREASGPAFCFHPSTFILSLPLLPNSPFTIPHPRPRRAPRLACPSLPGNPPSFRQTCSTSAAQTPPKPTKKRRRTNPPIRPGAIENAFFRKKTNPNEPNSPHAALWPLRHRSLDWPQRSGKHRSRRAPEKESSPPRGATYRSSLWQPKQP